ncbi:hypothetical protein D1007_61963 [Hordeum vulgare]|nr:hypothetical protein D1007_61963 [Hordeum vulgare]
MVVVAVETMLTIWYEPRGTTTPVHVLPATMMTISCDDIHSSAEKSSYESEANMSAMNVRASRNDERYRVAAITLPLKSQKNAPRNLTHQAKGIYEVTDIDLKSWDPTKLDKAGTIIRSVCGFVGRARLNISLSGFGKVDTETRKRIVHEIMMHFNVPEEWIDQVEHVALKKARDAWRN